MGIGENPITQQATVSVWEDVESMKKFAYLQAGHREIVQRTRQRGWYSEELFARFVPVAEWGEGNSALSLFRQQTSPEITPKLSDDLAD